MLLRRTKILATLGPATDKPGVLEALFDAGIDVVRLNFSHGSAQDHIDRANRVRELSKKTGRRVGKQLARQRMRRVGAQLLMRP